MVNPVRKIKRLLWIGGYPAAYTRKFIALIDSHTELDVRYIFTPVLKMDIIERPYERGALSLKSVIYNKESRKKCNTIIKEYAADPHCGILLWGLYPRILLRLAISLHKSRCFKLFFSDSNIADYGDSPAVYRIFYRWLMQGFDVFLSIGSQNALYYRWLLGNECYNKKKIVDFAYPHCHTDFANSNRNPIADTDTIHFLYLGRLSAIKNANAIAHAVVLLLERGIQRFHLTIAGVGEESEQLAAIVQEKHIEKKVMLCGAVPSTETASVYQQNHIFILPSHSEPWGVVVNEAMSAGLPVIAPLWAGAAVDLVITGYTGMKLTNNTPSAIADAMQWYIENSAQIEVQSHLAREHIVKSGKNQDCCFKQFRSLFGEN